jgi:hypothetical protein
MRDGYAFQERLTAKKIARLTAGSDPHITVALREGWTTASIHAKLGSHSGEPPIKNSRG